MPGDGSNSRRARHPVPEPPTKCPSPMLGEKRVERPKTPEKMTIHSGGRPSIALEERRPRLPANATVVTSAPLAWVRRPHEADHDEEQEVGRVPFGPTMFTSPSVNMRQSSTPCQSGVA